MAAGTILIACVPGYATSASPHPWWCCWADCCKVSRRGVELGGVSVYLAEIATPGRKGFFVSWQSASQQAAVVFAGLLGVGLNHWLSPEQMGDWGWRVPFLIGCLIVPVIFVIRRSLEETPDSRRANIVLPCRKLCARLSELRHRHRRHGAGGMTTVFYLITAYPRPSAKPNCTCRTWMPCWSRCASGISNFSGCR
jgi:MFS family permease